ncbi:unnamed protein product [Rodentolepis nana]|uniref:Ig-like domain-containing protein n=1 Tax=Rodentolepis nana TaxID=102285 RepID=A0A3P7U7Z3_RODNA|nr:unnamed protein product [Rodentolepis nana]
MRGDTVLQCQVNANPMGKILWVFGKSKSPINATSCSIPTNMNVKYCIVETQLKHEERWPSVISKLNILKLTEDDFGEYTCTVDTMMGTHSASTILERYVSETEQSMRFFNDPYFYLPPSTSTVMPYLQYHPNWDPTKESSYSHFRGTKKGYLGKDLRELLGFTIVLVLQFNIHSSRLLYGNY